ncbi:hypothetical protein [Enterococcus phage vB_EfaS_Ef6.4]|nr:hypothetical protein [Enterococcus phage vB_EfaS_Ef6.4]
MMKKLNNMTYEDGLEIYNYLSNTHGKRNVERKERKNATDIYLFGKYFDTYDNEGEPRGYKLVAVN